MLVRAYTTVHPELTPAEREKRKTPSYHPGEGTFKQQQYLHTVARWSADGRGPAL